VSYILIRRQAVYEPIGDRLSEARFSRHFFCFSVWFHTLWPA